ncbi:MAG: hypothetical protein H6642_11505 [Caldilineaceae bacterium]|nr:hypothetical protein [Caldilineaceae bacterium]
MTTPPVDPSGQFAEQAQGRMGAFEELLKGLPGIKGYVDKETRRTADKKLRTLMADQLDRQKRRLLDVQNQLLNSGGLTSVGETDRIVTRLQTLSDRIRTASYGYAGLFDAAKVQENELAALHRFDVAMAERIEEISEEIDALSTVVSGGGPVADAVNQLANTVNELDALYDKRSEAVLSPDLLMGTNYAPQVEADVLETADRLAAAGDALPESTATDDATDVIAGE